ncbi:P-loop containing nucleoside triphosphate hydrolase protein, partial [Mycena olivaceomarginata]
RKVDLFQCLKRLYSPTAHWKSAEQYAAVEALLALETDLIIRLPTGVGKTAAAVLPTIVEQGITVFVLPLIALIEDWERRLKHLGLEYERFGGSENPELKGNSKIILVTSDMAKRPEWKTAIAILDQRCPVLRTVIDELHYYAMDHGFREDALDNAFQLWVLPHQVVLMGATIPDAMERYLVDQFELNTCWRGMPERRTGHGRHAHQRGSSASGGDTGGHDAVRSLQNYQGSKNEKKNPNTEGR